MEDDYSFQESPEKNWRVARCTVKNVDNGDKIIKKTFVPIPRHSTKTYPEDEYLSVKKCKSREQNGGCD